MPQKVKIFISYYDEHPLIKSEILTPIQTGCSSAVKLFDGMLCDNTGDNISAANDRYCELSAQYWVGTHLSELGNPNYIGFMHYRRHFILDMYEWFQKHIILSMFLGIVFSFIFGLFTSFVYGLMK